MHPLPSGIDTLVLQGDFEAFAPQELFDYWVTPTLVTQWWPEQAEIVPGPGGHYTLSWPSMGWTLKGEYTQFDPPRKLQFTWKWSHEPVEKHHLMVSVDFAPAPEQGALLTITQGPYSDNVHDQEDRQGHLEGWIHFCMKLAGLREGIQDSAIYENP